MKHKLRYGDWEIYYAPKPVSTVDYDWEAVHEDYDGPENERAFTGSSVDDLINQIDEWEQEA